MELDWRQQVYLAPGRQGRDLRDQISAADDVHPHFVGEISAVTGQLFRAKGYSFVFDSGTNSYVRHPEARTRLFSLSDAGYIINVIPQEVELNSLQYRIVAGRLAITDDSGFSLEINEFGQSN